MEMKWFNYFFWFLFLTCTWKVFAEPRDDHEKDGIRINTTSNSHGFQEQPTTSELKVYLALIDDRKLQLEKANESLLNNANYAYWKSGALVAKAAIDGYCSAQLINGFNGVTLPAAIEGGTVIGSTSAAWSRDAVQIWIARGGLKKMKSVGFDVGLVGLSSAANEVLADDSHWTYHIPIFGTAFVAYTWSKKLMKTPELIEKNGREIALLTREKFKVQRYLKELEGR